MAAAWQIDRARARLRLDDRQEAAAIEVNLRRRELAAGFIRLGSIADGDGRARVLLAGLAHAAAAASARAARLSADEAALAREQRVANSAMAIWVTRRAASLADQISAGERWRRALRHFAAHAADRDRESGASSASVALTKTDPVTLASAAIPARGSAMPAPRDHKLAMPIDRRLDRRLLRVVGSPRAVPRVQRRLAAPTLSDRPVLPIAGRLLEDASPAIVIATAVDQVVSSPVGGRVVFAEPFRGFGPLLIIDRGEGYHVVLSGLTWLDVGRGASLVAGQSVGGVAAREDGPARLHFELRYRGLPIDPAPWLAAYQDKVRS